jgi:gluconate 2-dehydrogenase gamma chain
MDRDPDDTSRGLSRRALFARAAALGAGALAIGADASMLQTRPGAVPARPPLETLTSAEAEILDAIAARLIPSDDNGPGAAEAQAAHYIDRALGGALSASREAYRTGLAAVDAYALTSKRAPFARLAAPDQDAVLRDMEGGVATGFMPDASTFFNLVRTHTIQGTFSDPFYGGNANFVGWDLIGYPGIRMAAGADDQRMDRRPTPLRRSAYEHAMFVKKKPARAHVQTVEEPWLLS